MRSFFAILIFASVVLAQPKLTATVDRSTVRVGESFSLTLTFDGAATGVSNPTLPPPTGIQVTSAPYTSTNMSIVNGRTSSSITYTYRLRATKEGKQQIGAAAVSYQGKSYESLPLIVNVLAAGATPPGTAAGQAADDPANAVFIRAIPDRSEVFQGEQLTVSYKIFFNVQMTNPEITKIPRAAGFWIEEIAIPQQLHLNDEVVNGKAYKSAIIRKLALFPTTTGDLEIEPMEVKTKIERRQRKARDPLDIFNDPFFRLGSSMEPVDVVSPQVKIKGRPLPDGAPPEFAGAVGNFKMSATLERPQVSVNDAVTFSVKIEGTGNIKTLPEPSIQFPADFDRFDPKQSEQISRGAKISGVKLFEYVLIPRAPGEQIIPEIRYAFFDPASEKYQLITVPEQKLIVGRGRGESGATGSAPSIARRDVASVGSDIAYIKKEPDSFQPIGKAPHQLPTYWVLAISPWLAAAGAFVFVARRDKKSAATPTFARQVKIANKQLGFAAKVAQKDSTEAVRLILSGLDSVLNEPGVPEAEAANIATLRERWNTAQRNPDALEKLLRIQHDCNLVRFGIGKADAETCRKLIRETDDALSLIDQAAKKVRANG